MRTLRVLAIGCCLSLAPVWADEKSPSVPLELQPQAQKGRDEFQRGDYGAAEKTYREILTKAPDNLHTLSNLGVVLFRAKKLKQAEESFKQAIAVDPGDGFSHCTLGIIYYSEGEYDEAIHELTTALAIDPKNATAHNYLGLAASKKGWSEAAQMELAKAAELDGSYADANYNLAVVLARKSPPDKEGARNYYQRALQAGASRDSAMETLIEWRTIPGNFLSKARKAKSQFDRGDYAGAEKTYREIVTAASENVPALSSLAVILYRQRKYAAAEEMLKKALTLAPEDDLAHGTLGLVYYGQRKFNEAVEELTKAAQSNAYGNVPRAYLKLLQEQKGWQEATQQEMESAVQLDPVYQESSRGQFRGDLLFTSQEQKLREILPADVKEP